MTTVSSGERAVTGIKVALGVGGAIALIAGILILAWPSKTAMVVTAIIAVYALVAGLVYAGVGVFGKSGTGWARIGHVALGVVFVIAGIIALTNLGQTTVWLAVFLGILVGVMWIVEGIAALSTASDSSSKTWTIVFAIISVLAGITVLLSPMWGVTVLWWLLGISLVVLGLLNIVRAFTFGSRVVRDR